MAPNQIFVDSVVIGNDDADSLEQLLVWSAALMSCERAEKHMSDGTLINLAYRGNMLLLIDGGKFNDALPFPKLCLR